MEKIIRKQQNLYAVINGKVNAEIKNSVVFQKTDFQIMKLLLSFYNLFNTSGESGGTGKIIPGVPTLSMKRSKSDEGPHKAFAGLHNPVIIFGAGGKVRWMNAACQQLANIASKENADPLQLELMDLFWPAVRENKSAQCEFKGQREDGTAYWVQFNATPVSDESGKTEYVIIIGSDITAIKKREDDLVFANQMSEHSLRKGYKALDKLIKAKEEIENCAKMKDRFFACMSHEIRTPMNGILGITELLLKTPLSDEQKEYLNTIKSTGDSLLVVINDILDLSKIEAGKISFEEIPFCVSEVIGNAVNVFQGKAKEKNILLRSEIDHALTWMLLGDPFRLSQILMNLVSNAVKFTEAGEVVLTAGILREEAESITIEITVSDTGIGISNEKLKELFSEFTQVHTPSASMTREGTGLGLAISRKLAELQGGKITVQSVEKKGSSLTLVLPYKKCRLAFGLKKKTDMPSTGIPISSAGVSLNGISILLAEDNPVNQLVGKRLLLDNGATVQVAANGIVAIEMLKKQVFDIVLMDIRMPEMDGYEATRYIRNEMGIPASRLPVIALTAYTGSSEIKKCMHAGMNDYVSKPFKVNELCGKIKKIVKENKKHSIISVNTKKSVYELH